MESPAGQGDLRPGVRHIVTERLAGNTMLAGKIVLGQLAEITKPPREVRFDDVAGRLREVSLSSLDPQTQGRRGDRFNIEGDVIDFSINAPAPWKAGRGAQPLVVSLTAQASPSSNGEDLRASMIAWWAGW